MWLVNYPDSEAFAVDLSKSPEHREVVFSCSNCADTKIFATRNVDEFAKHLAQEHHMPVILPGEDLSSATARFIKENPMAQYCADCRDGNAPWTHKQLAQSIAGLALFARPQGM